MTELEVAGQWHVSLCLFKGGGFAFSPLDD